MAPINHPDKDFTLNKLPCYVFGTTSRWISLVSIMILCLLALSYSIRRYRQCHRQHSLDQEFHQSQRLDLSNFKEAQQKSLWQLEDPGSSTSFQFQDAFQNFHTEPFSPIHSGVIAARVARAEQLQQRQRSEEEILYSPLPPEYSSTSDGKGSWQHDSYPPFSPLFAHNNDEMVKMEMPRRIVKDKDEIETFSDSNLGPLDSGEEGLWNFTRNNLVSIEFFLLVRY